MHPVRWSKEAFRVGIALAVAAILLAGCNSATNLSLPGTGPLVTVRAKGGMCMDGPCGSMVVLERDGVVHDGATPRGNLGRVPADAYATLDAAIQTNDFAAMRAVPFTGECPIAFDGQKQVFEFAVGTATERLDSCETEIDWSSPLFVAIVLALGEWVQAPLF